MSESNSVGTPSVRETVSDVSPLPSCDATIYRALVARANYLSQDRLDIAFAVKELCRQMASPRVCDWNALKRLGRYLVSRPRIICRFAHQSAPESVCVWTDSDHAGCRETRKSTSGGVIMIGSHLIKAWSSLGGVRLTNSFEHLKRDFRSKNSARHVQNHIVDNYKKRMSTITKTGFDTNNNGLRHQQKPMSTPTKTDVDTNKNRCRQLQKNDVNNYENGIRHQPQWASTPTKTDFDTNKNAFRHQ